MSPVNHQAINNAKRCSWLVVVLFRPGLLQVPNRGMAQANVRAAPGFGDASFAEYAGGQRVSQVTSCSERIANCW
jgi:hypothetical protein